jgi:hypothetical protein
MAPESMETRIRSNNSDLDGIKGSLIAAHIRFSLIRVHLHRKQTHVAPVAGNSLFKTCHKPAVEIELDDAPKILPC